MSDNKPSNPFANSSAPTGGWGSLASSGGQQGGGAWGGAPSSGSAWGAPPPRAPAPPQYAMPPSQYTYNEETHLVSQAAQPVPQLAFTSSTAPPVASGMLGSNPQGGYRPSGPMLSGPSSTSDVRPLLTDPKSTSNMQGGGSGGGPPHSTEDTTNYAFYNLKRYRKYFDVDTKEVLWRVMSSLIGVFKPDFMEVTLSQPDLYGPFWIATTLIFVTAAAGNLSGYIDYSSKQTSPPPPFPSPPLPADNSSAPVTYVPPVPPIGPASEYMGKQWFSDPTKLGTSAAIFYGYIFLLSIVLWLWVKYLKAEIRLVNMFCIYGYSMSIFIPISIMCIIPSDIARWVMVMVSAGISAGFLYRNMRDTTSDVALAKSIWLLGTIVILHLGIGILLKLFFFNY